MAAEKVRVTHILYLELPTLQENSPQVRNILKDNLKHQQPIQTVRLLITIFCLYKRRSHRICPEPSIDSSVLLNNITCGLPNVSICKTSSEKCQPKKLTLRLKLNVLITRRLRHSCGETLAYGISMMKTTTWQSTEHWHSRKSSNLYD